MSHVGGVTGTWTWFRLVARALASMGVDSRADEVWTPAPVKEAQMDVCVKCETGRMGQPRYVKTAHGLEKLVRTCGCCGYERSSPTADSKAAAIIKKLAQAQASAKREGE